MYECQFPWGEVFLKSNKRVQRLAQKGRKPFGERIGICQPDSKSDRTS